MVSHEEALKILGVTNTDTKKKVKQQFAKLAKRFHPDKYVGNKVLASQLFQKIHEAFKIVYPRAATDYINCDSDNSTDNNDLKNEQPASSRQNNTKENDEEVGVDEAEAQPERKSTRFSYVFTNYKEDLRPNAKSAENIDISSTIDDESAKNDGTNGNSNTENSNSNDNFASARASPEENTPNTATSNYNTTTSFSTTTTQQSMPTSNININVNFNNNPTFNPNIRYPPYINATNAKYYYNPFSNPNMAIPHPNIPPPPPHPQINPNILFNPFHRTAAPPTSFNYNLNMNMNPRPNLFPNQNNLNVPHPWLWSHQRPPSWGPVFPPTFYR